MNKEERIEDLTLIRLALQTIYLQRNPLRIQFPSWRDVANLNNLSKQTLPTDVLCKVC